MAKKKITQLDPATSVNSDALFPLSQEDNNEAKTFKGTIEQLGDYINKSQDFNTLNTNSKKAIGAINEVLAIANKDIISSITTPAPIMTFNDGGDNIPVNKLLVAVTATQAGSGTPSPSNPRAISGWSQAQITRCGKNAYSKSLVVGQRANSTTGAVESYENGACTDYMSVKGGADYYLSGLTNGLNSYVSFYDQNKTYISRTNSGAVTTRDFTIPDNACYCILSIVKVTGQTADISTVLSLTPQLEFGTTATTYEAYKGITVVIPFGDTYYGGVLDVVNNTLTVTHGYIEYDGSSDETWYYSESSGGKRRVYVVITDCKPATSNIIANWLDYYSAGAGYPNVNTMQVNSNATPSLLIGVDSTITQASDWTTYLSTHTLQVVFELNTPVVINLTPTQISTLSGLNNIYADCGDIQELEYFNENADDVAELNRAMSDDFHVYSTAEQIVGKWMGDDLYEKSYHYTQATVPTQATAVVIDNAISNLNLASLVDMTCAYKTHHISQNYDVWYHGALANTQLDYSTGKLLFYQKATSQQQNYSDLEVNITIRYTKAS